MNRWRTLGLLAALVAFPAFAQELPVTKVVLYTSGVGYFEHQGSVNGSATVALNFQTEQINDLLKSLILRDPAGAVGTVTYPSQVPFDQALQRFRIDLSGSGGLTSLLPQLRGLAMTLKTPTDVTGRLVGFDTRNNVARAESTDVYLTLSTATGLQTLPLSSVTSLTLLDASLNQELDKALKVLAARHDTGRTTVELRFSGTGNRPVSAGYLAEAPIWKTSYRLDLGTKPYLQAWAIVENYSATDWSNIRLSLVSGRPVSFQQDLYTPLFVERPWYTPETQAGPAPRVNAGGMATPKVASAPAPAPSVQKSAKMAESMDYGETPMELSPSLATSGFSAASTSAKAGELFQFTLAVPFSLARQQSALIPLTAGEVTAEKVSLYRAATDPRYPMNAVWLTNSSGQRLPAGPVTVFDAGTYAGDAVTDSLVENDRRLWSYATDLSVLASFTQSSQSTTTRISASKGLLTFRNEITWTSTYTFDNKSSAAKTVLVEQDLHSERTLIRPAQAAETTADLSRFRVDAPAGKATAFEVVEKQLVAETQSVAGWSRDSFLSVIQRGGGVSVALKESLQKAADLRAKWDQATADVASLAQQKTDEENGQSRIRSNLSAVGRDTAQGQGYLKKLADSDSRIEQLATAVTDKRQSQAQAQKDFETWLRNLSAD